MSIRQRNRERTYFLGTVRKPNHLQFPFWFKIKELRHKGIGVERCFEPVDFTSQNAPLSLASERENGEAMLGTLFLASCFLFSCWRKRNGWLYGLSSIEGRGCSLLNEGYYICSLMEIEDSNFMKSEPKSGSEEGFIWVVVRRDSRISSARSFFSPSSFTPLFLNTKKSQYTFSYLKERRYP